MIIGVSQNGSRNKKTLRAIIDNQITIYHTQDTVLSIWNIIQISKSTEPKI